MKIAKVEIEVVKMTDDEANDLWRDWKDHYKTGKDVYVCGHLVHDWDTDDGRNELWLMCNGVQKCLSISRE